MVRVPSGTAAPGLREMVPHLLGAAVAEDVVRPAPAGEPSAIQSFFWGLAGAGFWTADRQAALEGPVRGGVAHAVLPLHVAPRLRHHVFYATDVVNGGAFSRIDHQAFQAGDPGCRVVDPACWTAPFHVGWGFGTPAAVVHEDRIWVFYTQAAGDVIPECANVRYRIMEPDGTWSDSMSVPGARASQGAVTAASLSSYVYVAWRGCGDGARPIQWTRCSGHACTALVGDASADNPDSGALEVLVSPFEPALAASGAGTLWLVYARMTPTTHGMEPVLHVASYRGGRPEHPPTWNWPVVVGVAPGTVLSRDGEDCTENPTVFETPVMDGPTAVVFRGRLHVAALSAFDAPELPPIDRGTIIYASSAAPHDRASWSRIVPQLPYGASGLDPRLAAGPNALFLWQGRQVGGSGLFLPFVRAKFSE